MSAKHNSTIQESMKSINAPSGFDGEKFSNFSASQQVLVVVPANLSLSPDAQPEQIVLPAGAFYLFNARRQCGDWYAEINGKQYLSAIGSTQAEAIRNCVARFGGEA